MGLWDKQDKILRNHRHCWMWPYEAEAPLPEVDSAERFLFIKNGEGHYDKLVKRLKRHYG